MSYFPMPRLTRNRAPPRHVSFANDGASEETVAVATPPSTTVAERKREEARLRKEARSRLAAEKRAREDAEKQARREAKEQARAKKAEEERIAGMEKELQKLRHEKYVRELEKETHQRETREDMEEQRQARITTDELLKDLDPTSLPANRFYTPKQLAEMKLREEAQEGPFTYSCSALVCIEGSQRNVHVWENKIGGIHQSTAFNINLLNLEVDRAMGDHALTSISDISGRVRSSNSRGSRQRFTLKELNIDE